jgi:copper transport protein
MSSESYLIVRRRARRFARRRLCAQCMRVKKSLRHRALALVVALAAIIATPVLLFAHAHLVKSTPAANSRIATAPTALTLWFSERPELALTTLQLIDSSGASHALGPVTYGAESASIVSEIMNPLSRGTYTVLWHTAASDGHATGGRFSFTVTSGARNAAHAAAAQAAPTVPPSPAAATGTSKSNAPLQAAPASPVSAPLRWAELIAVLTLVGAMVFQLVVLPAAGWPESVANDAGDRTRRFAQAALLLFVITTLMRLSGESTLVPDPRNSRVADMWTVVNATRWGIGWSFGAVGVIVAAVGLFAARRARSGWFAAAIGVVAICASESLTGHAGASSHSALAIATDVAHVLAGGGWLGGLTVVLLCGLPALRSVDEPERPAAGARLVRAYHSSAVECVVLVLITAVIGAWLRLTAFSDLWTTHYGTILLIKIALVIVVLIFGLFHWKRVVSVDWEQSTRPRFARSATAELLIGALVIGASAALISTALPMAAVPPVPTVLEAP